MKCEDCKKLQDFKDIIKDIKISNSKLKEDNEEILKIIDDMFDNLHRLKENIQIMRDDYDFICKENQKLEELVLKLNKEIDDLKSKQGLHE